MNLTEALIFIAVILFVMTLNVVSDILGDGMTPEELEAEERDVAQILSLW